MNHLMIDIETCGTKKDSMLWAVGIQEFRINRTECQMGDSYMFYTDPKEQAAFLNHGLVFVSRDALTWTMSHGDAANFEPWYAAMQVYAGEDESVPEVSLTSYPTLKLWRIAEVINILTQREDTLVWAKGKEFDLGILSYHFNLIGVKDPWHYRNAMCMRTLDGLLRTYGINPPRPEPTHNALDDATEQVKTLSRQIDELETVMMTWAR